MPKSASFVVRSFEAIYASSGDVERILALTMECGECKATSSSGAGSLVELPGGALFRCAHCGRHQAVSNARLSAMQGPTGGKPSAGATPARAATSAFNADCVRPLLPLALAR